MTRKFSAIYTPTRQLYFGSKGLADLPWQARMDGTDPVIHAKITIFDNAALAYDLATAKADFAITQLKEYVILVKRTAIGEDDTVQLYGNSSFLAGYDEGAARNHAIDEWVAAMNAMYFKDRPQAAPAK